MVAIGGWNEGSTGFSTVMGDATLRAAFVKNAATFVRTYGFDGLDIDWEYPAQRGGVPADKTNFGLLCAQLRTEFDKYGLILSAAVLATQNGVSTSYDVAAMSQNLDFINLMTYDLHGSWDGVTGQNGPLYPSSLDKTAAQLQLNDVSCLSCPHDLIF